MVKIIMREGIMLSCQQGTITKSSYITNRRSYVRAHALLNLLN